MKMKMNMIVGKKQIILASLVLILGVAIYLNWQFASTDQPLSVSNQLDGTSGKNYGDAELVNKKGDDYFATAKLEKQKNRDQASESLQTLLGKTDLTAEEKTNATNQTLEIAKMIESEGKIENLVRAKGFSDCIAYVDADKVNVVVKTEELDAAQAAQIKDIVVTETNALAENIVITPTK